IAFCLVLFSVLGSGIGQNVEIHMRSKKILPLKIIFDRTFIKDIVSKNRNYGVSYYLSSFHTLLPLLLLTRFYPTISGKDYSGTRGLALGLIEILLIIPSALGNSLLHKIPKYEKKDKLRSMGSLMNLMIWIGGIAAINFWIFADIIIKICSSKDYLGSFASIAQRGSNQVIPFLGIVLFASFVKQVYNYIFVATDQQNVLLKINGVGVIVGLILGLSLIPSGSFGLGRGLLGATITQVAMELVFMGGAIYVGIRKDISPIIDKKILRRTIGMICLFAVIGIGVTYNMQVSYTMFFILASIFNGTMLLISRKSLKKMGRGLTVDESGQEIHPEETYA
ncbi:MAG: oligosaccharide flippase family protein, partial [Candidatus Absconditabacteria bacterium]